PAQGAYAPRLGQRRYSFLDSFLASSFLVSSFLTSSFFAGSFLGGSFFSSLGGAGGGSVVVSSWLSSVGGGISVVYLSSSTFSPPLMVHMALKMSSGILSGMKRTEPSAMMAMVPFLPS